MFKKLLLLAGLLLPSLAGWAQRENANWYFGVNAAASFSATNVPSAVAGSAMYSYEACAVASDNTGQLLFYTNSESIWNRNNQLMPGGTNLGGHQSCTQGAAIVQNPANLQQYYVFSLDAAENQLRGGLKYSLVDMSHLGGLGEVVSARNQVSAVPLTEKLTTVPHANGRDTWVLVHGWQTNNFYAYLLSPAGLAPTPVVSSIGSIPTGGGGQYSNANAVGYLRASPDGTKLALGVRDQSFELYNFSASTGQVSNYATLPIPYRAYGVEFSPDGTKLYGTDLDGLSIYQFNLQAGSAAAIAASRQQVGTTASTVGAVQRGPDNKLYVAIYNNTYLGVIDNPNALGTGCGFRANAVGLSNGSLSQVGLPNYPSSRAVVPTLTFTTTGSCVGSAVAFAGAITPASSLLLPSWNFGDAASGSANTATGLTASHTYVAAGTYQVTFSASYSAGGAAFTTTQTVTVLPRPTVRLGRDTAVCGTQVVLAPNAQPAGSTYRWQDGSAGATYVAKATGRYRVTVTSPGGCSSADSVRVTLNALPTVRLADTTACAAAVLLRPGSQPAGTTYRWQDGSTNATYTAQASGTYSVVVTTAQGCQASATSHVVVGPMPTVQLGADTLVCATASFTLRTSPQPAGSTYRWQDGSTSPTFLAHGPGTYSVQVRNATGCTASATRVAGIANCLVVIPNVITPNGDAQNEYFELKGLTATEWHLSVFDRWGRQLYDQPSYDNHWNASGLSAGIYYYLLRNTGGQQYKGWVEVLRN